MLSARNRTAGQATLRDAVLALATPPQVVVGRHQHGRPRSLAGTWIAGVRRFGPLSCVCRCFGSSPATKHLATYLHKWPNRGTPPLWTSTGHQLIGWPQAQIWLQIARVGRRTFVVVDPFSFHSSQ
ncbi:hypothetical protein HPB52_006303 [Rhipicephalus sanguineus]|uniref:Uncharacterized protein n=1 Tax=Rhipicephalus sanguineus TaxID=34632 RepID=A0A9D4PBQ9_RHISA|nr:hypothetical protein HPB52_006303 [Rhipicephalus sanguineus]